MARHRALRCYCLLRACLLLAFLGVALGREEVPRDVPIELAQAVRVDRVDPLYQHGSRRGRTSFSTRQEHYVQVYHERERRSSHGVKATTTHADTVLLQLRASDRTYTLNLTRDDALVRGLRGVIRTVSVHDGLHQADRESCHYTGHVVSYADSMVAVSTCDDVLRGVVHVDGDAYHVGPAHEHSDRLPEGTQLQAGDHVMYRRSDLHRARTAAPSCVAHDAAGQQEHDLSKQRQRTRNAPERDALSAPHTQQPHQGSSGATLQAGTKVPRVVQLLVVMEPDAVRFHGGPKAAESYALLMVAMANRLYETAAFDPPVQLVVTKTALFETQAPFALEADPDDLLSSFCTWQASARHQYRHDHAVLITRSPMHNTIIGYARIGKVCDPQHSCSIARDTGYDLSDTIAHELAHNMGGKHDGLESWDTSTCEGDRYIMAARAGSMRYSSHWSVCTVKDVNKFLASDENAGCLQPPEGVVRGNGEEANTAAACDATLPGMCWDPDSQCQQEYGAMHTHCADVVEECTALLCRSGSEETCFARHYHKWMDGTPCSNGTRMCINGECVAPTSEIIPPPELSPKGGVYEEALTMEIRSSHPAAVIRYTTDGSLPGSRSPQYTQPVRIDAGLTTVRATLFVGDKPASAVSSVTYNVAAAGRGILCRAHSDCAIGPDACEFACVDGKCTAVSNECTQGCTTKLDGTPAKTCCHGICTCEFGYQAGSSSDCSQGPRELVAGQEVNFIMPARGVEHFVFVPSQDARQKGLMNKDGRVMISMRVQGGQAYLFAGHGHVPSRDLYDDAIAARTGESRTLTSSGYQGLHYFSVYTAETARAGSGGGGAEMNVTVSARVEDYEEPSPTTAQTWIITASITCSAIIGCSIGVLAYFIYRKRRPPTPPPEPQLFAVDAALLRPTTPDQDDDEDRMLDPAVSELTLNDDDSDDLFDEEYTGSRDRGRRRLFDDSAPFV